MSANGMAAGCVSARAETMRAKASAASSQLKLFHELLVKLGFVFIESSFLSFRVVVLCVLWLGCGWVWGRRWLLFSLFPPPPLGRVWDKSNTVPGASTPPP